MHQPEKGESANINVNDNLCPPPKALGQRLSSIMPSAATQLAVTSVLMYDSRRMKCYYCCEAGTFESDAGDVF